MLMHTTDHHRAHATANCLLLLLVTALFASIAFAEEPRLVPFQARLTDASGADLTGVYRVSFVIYDAATGGTALWSEVHPSVSVIAGRLNVLLGSITSLDDYNGDGNTADAVQFDRPRFVGIKVGADNIQEMVPRHQLISAFHARNSDKLGGYSSEYLVPNGAIVMWSGLINNIPQGWALCDGANGTPDLRDRFILGTDGENPGAIGGAQNITLTESHLPSHSHSINGITGAASNDHSHSGTTNVTGNHAHTLKTESNATGAGAPEQGTWANTYTDEQTGSAGNHSHTFTTGGISQNHIHGMSLTSGLTGAGSPIDNRPKFFKLAFIMKI